MKHGDRVTLEFEGKTFCGIIDLESASPPASPAGRESSPLSPSKCLKVVDSEELAGEDIATTELKSRKRKARIRSEISVPEPKKAKTRLVEKKAGMY